MMVDEAPLTDAGTAGITGAFGWADAFVHTQLSGASGNTSRVYSVATDAAGNVYAVGEFNGHVDFDPDPSATNVLISSGKLDGFLTKFDAAGRLRWVIPFASSTGEDDIVRGVAVDHQGNVIVTGLFSGPMDIDRSSSTRVLTTDSAGDGFVAKYDPSGRLVWGSALTGTGSSIAAFLAVDPTSDAIAVVGKFKGSVDFDASDATATLTTAPNDLGDAFVAKYDAAGRLEWVTKAAGSDHDYMVSVAFDPQGDVVAAGDFKSGTLQVFSANGAVGGQHVSKNTTYFDGFVAKFDGISGDYEWSKDVGATYDDGIKAVAVDSRGRITIGGFFNASAPAHQSSTLTFAPNVAFTETNAHEGFIAQYDAAGTFL
jgi:hypothetical protein